MTRTTLLFMAAVTGLASFQNACGARAQEDEPVTSSVTLPEARPDDVDPGSVAIIRQGGEESPPLARYSARLVVSTEGQEAQLRITALLAEGLHTYPMTDIAGRQTRLELAPSPWLEVAGPAQPDRQPDEPADASAESAGSYRGQIEFVVPLTVLAPPPDGDWQMLVRINGLLCSDGGFCVPVQDRILRAAVERQPAVALPVAGRQTLPSTTPGH